MLLQLPDVLQFSHASVLLHSPGLPEVLQILSEAEYQEAKEKWGRHAFRVGMGAESIKELLESIDLEKEYAELQAGLEKCQGSDPYGSEFL